MKIEGNTILITGGSSGIGFEMAKAFSQKNNTTIILGRDEMKLNIALSQLKNTSGIVCDVTNEREVNGLVERAMKDFPALNMVINNAGRGFGYKLVEGANAMEKASEEMMTNYLSVIRLNEKMLPILKQQKEAAIVNVSSEVVFAPKIVAPTYAASKAALHAYTMVLRLTLKQMSFIKVFEIMPSLTNTEFSQDIGGSKGLAPSFVAEALLNGMKNNEYEIHTGHTPVTYKLFLSSPSDALNAINGIE